MLSCWHAGRERERWAEHSAPSPAKCGRKWSRQHQAPWKAPCTKSRGGLPLLPGAGAAYRTSSLVPQGSRCSLCSTLQQHQAAATTEQLASCLLVLKQEH